MDTADDGDTPLPPPLAEHEIPGSITREAEDFLSGDSKIKPVVKRAVDAVEELEAEQEREERARARPIETGVPYPERRIPAWFWFIATAFVLGALFLILYTQTDVFHPERARAKEERAEREQKAYERRLYAQQKKGGNILIKASQDGAAAWLLLGRTPVDTMPLPLDSPHQLRFEREGYVGQDMVVKASHWTGDRASIHRTLVTAEADDEPLPAGPPPVPESARNGFPETKKLGILRLESTLPGVQVWLLVGYTPEVRMTDFEAGADYEFKVLKDGFRPGVAVIHAADWQLDPEGDPRLMRSTILKTVNLEPLP
jgi:hypothetical protein